MNWEKLNMKEVNYYCRTSDIDFDCLPFSTQIECIISMYYYYNIEIFTIDDIKEFYKIMQIPSPRNGAVRKPSNTQIQKAIDKMNNIHKINEYEYEILRADIELYEIQIKQGYDKNRIK